MKSEVTIFACEAQPIVLTGLETLLAQSIDLMLVGSAEDLLRTAQEIRSTQADVVLIGQPPAARSPLPSVTQAKELGIEPLLVLWANEISDIDAYRALQMGASGIIARTRSNALLLECLRSVGNGLIWIEGAVQSSAAESERRLCTVRLTPREQEILAHVRRGLKNKQIAEALAITPGTVKIHLMHIFEKTGVKDRMELVLRGVDLHEPSEEKP